MPSAAKKKVLIATWSGDGPNISAVVQHLKRHSYQAILFEPDSIARGTRSFSAKIIDSNAPVFEYDGQLFDPRSFGAAWSRKPSFYGGHTNIARWLELKDEYNALPTALWDFFPPDIWLSTPRDIGRANSKLTQLQLAHTNGFIVPDTVISNTWQSVESMSHSKLVVKMARPVVVSEGNQVKVLPTTIVSKDNLPRSVSPYPGIWQQYIDKKREWRITVVGEQVFAAAIYTADHAKDDWRRHQFDPLGEVRFRHEPFPKDIQKKCVKLLKDLNLRYGAFDFVETNQGDMVFLEVNPSGQFMWIEERLHLPISEAIANELITIAERP